MPKVQNTVLKQLFSELKFAPLKQKLKQLRAITEFYPDIDPETQYPLDFVCFRITGYRPRQTDQQITIPGDDLIRDLRRFITQLSRTMSIPSAAADEDIFTIAQLAEKYSVSERTVTRWQSRGLIGWVYLFADSKKRMAFTKSAIDKFLTEHPHLTEKASKFSRLTNDEKAKIIKHARSLASRKISRSQVINKLAKETSRSIETIRCILLEHEDSNPSNRIFTKKFGVISPKEAALMYKLYAQGTKPAELMERFQRSRSSIYRIINNRRARTILTARIKYIDSTDFNDPALGDDILTAGPTSLPGQVKLEKGAYLLTRDQEKNLFRKYNYLKFLVAKQRANINLTNPNSQTLDRIEHYLTQAEQIKQMIIEANLRLVVSIAGKHLSMGPAMPELISEGNVALMRAVEKFNYQRGFRFSTYASWIIAKDFARNIPAEAARPDKPSALDVSDFEQNMRIPTVADVAAIEHAHQSLLQVIKDNLTDREQYIIQKHFALSPEVVKEKPQSLKQIGQTLNLTKERVRQIELQALQKLRHCLSPEQFDLLTESK